MKTATIEANQWNQEYILRISSGFEIPLDINDRPNPEVWTWTNRPKKGVDDYYSMIVTGQPIVRHFSKSTHTWYDSEHAKYVPFNDMSHSISETKTTAIKKELKLESNKFGDNAEIGFSSIENFFA